MTGLPHPHHIAGRHRMGRGRSGELGDPAEVSLTGSCHPQSTGGYTPCASEMPSPSAAHMAEVAGHPPGILCKERQLMRARYRWIQTGSPKDGCFLAAWSLTSGVCQQCGSHALYSQGDSAHFNPLHSTRRDG